MSNIVEVFSGIQGEGTIVGVRQVFVRFSQCQLDCQYCDTNFQERTYAQIETIPGQRTFTSWENPVSAERLVEHIVGMNQAISHHSVSITGGEPLLHSGYLAEMLPLLKYHGLSVYLETNGLLHRELYSIIDQIDMIGMDIKLASTTKQPTQWDEHREFLRVANQKQVFIKVVVGEGTTEQEMARAARMVHETAKAAPLIIQPATSTHGIIPPNPGHLLTLMDVALAFTDQVRVIPQTHVMLNQL